MKLTPNQARILGSLIEKEITTSEYYPLSLNALRNACNQSSSREPVMTLDEDEVRQGLHALSDLSLVDSAHDARVPKFEHRVRDQLQLRRDETAVLCLLLLRGPQTPGELRTRSERLFHFDEPAQVLSNLQRMAERELVAQLPRQPGSRESRWTELLAGSAETVAKQAVTPQTDEMSDLRRELEELKKRVEILEKSAEKASNSTV